MANEKDPNEFLSLPMFIKELRCDYGVTIDRRTLQFYCSPAIHLMPVPDHYGKHTAHYPRKYIDWVRAILLLRTAGWSILEIQCLFPNLMSETICLIPDHVVLKDRVAWLLGYLKLPRGVELGIIPLLAPKSCGIFETKLRKRQ